MDNELKILQPIDYTGDIQDIVEQLHAIAQALEHLAGAVKDVEYNTRKS